MAKRENRGVYEKLTDHCAAVVFTDRILYPGDLPHATYWMYVFQSYQAMSVQAIFHLALITPLTIAR